MAKRRRTLYVSPDMYLYNQAGMSDYNQAANGFLADRFLFATEYPLVEYTRWFRQLLLRDEVMRKALYENATRLLGLA